MRMDITSPYAREQIEQALNGKLAFEENEGGYAYAPARWEDCKKFVFEAFLEAVYQLRQVNLCARALERILKDHGIEVTMREYIPALRKEELELGTKEEEMDE